MTSAAPFRYRSQEEDSTRWWGFDFRPGDIVISTRSKHGTTWMQMICALLVFQSTGFSARLAELSPWLDWLGVPVDEVHARLHAQRHRRFIKTHTPLDGLPLDRRATHIVVARHPLDAAVSLHAQGDNLDRERIRRLTGRAAPTTAAHRPPLREWLLDWIDRDENPREKLDSLPGVMWHLSDAWARRGEPNVVLVHYDDLRADLGSQMRRLAHLLGIEVVESLWADLVRAAGFEQMRTRAAQLAPDPAGILRSHRRFFRRGSSGAGRELLSPAELRRYHDRARSLLPVELSIWLHRDDEPSGRRAGRRPGGACPGRDSNPHAPGGDRGV